MILLEIGTWSHLGASGVIRGTGSWVRPCFAAKYWSRACPSRILLSCRSTLHVKTTARRLSEKMMHICLHAGVYGAVCAGNESADVSRAAPQRWPVTENSFSNQDEMVAAMIRSDWWCCISEFPSRTFDLVSQIARYFQSHSQNCEWSKDLTNF